MEPTDKNKNLENSDETPYDMVLLNNGKFIATGYYSDSSGDNSITMRFNADGSLDNTFGESGIIRTEVESPMNTLHQ